MKKDVRILLIGDPGVGKTSLILSLVSEEFPAVVPARTEEITIPPDVTPERVPTHIVDFSLREQTEAQLHDELARASVVILVYALNDSASQRRLYDHWLPSIRRVLSVDHKKPIVLAGNKADLVNIPPSVDELLPLMKQYAEIETCIQCSAKNLHNLSELFYYAQKSVIHPTLPIYHAEEKDLTPLCKKALTRIFRICDQDNDGRLNDRELNTFQRRCFKAPLQPHALDDVKTLLRKHSAETIQSDAVTLKGFLSLHKLFVQKGRHETTWNVLRTFGYDDTLAFSSEYLHVQLYVRHGSSTELSNDGYQFLVYLFDKYDTDRDFHLSPRELGQLFALAPVAPWGADSVNMVRTNDRGWYSLQGWIAMWTLQTSLDVNQVIEYLAYFGYNYEHESQISAIQVTRDRRVDLARHQTSRSVFQCQVIGARGVGKTTLLQGLLGRNQSLTCSLRRDQLPSYTIGAVTLHGHEKHLVLHEIDVGITDKLTQAELQCDVVCLVYDVTDTQSFDYIARLYLQHFHLNQIPVLIVAAKAEQTSVLQDYSLQPAAFAHKYGLAPPAPFYCVDMISSDVYTTLTAMATYPHLSPPGAAPDLARWARLLCLAGAGLIGVTLLYKLIRRPRARPY